MQVKTRLNSKRNNSINLVLVLSFLVYSVTWSYFVLLRYYSFNAGVFDLGLASNTLFNIAHEGILKIVSNPAIVPLNKMITVILAVPYSIFPNPAWLIVFQSVWLGLGIFPLYKIAKKITNQDFPALLIAVSYLLYYPLTGVNWFDFHFMSIFPTAFLFSLMYYMDGKKAEASAFGVLAIISDYLIPLTFLFLTLYLILDRKRNSGKTTIDSFNITSIVASLLVLIVVNVMFGIGSTTHFLNMSGSTSSVTYIAPVSEKVWYFYAMLLPVLFLSMIGIDFLAVGIPYFALAFVNSYEPYVSTIFFQYPALIAPILFVSALIGLKRIGKFAGMNRKRLVRNVSISVLVLNVVLFAFFSPIGNAFTGSMYEPQIGRYVSGNPYSYGSMNDITVTQYDHYLSEIIKTIPKGSKVLIQNNMPQLCGGYDSQLPDFMSSGFKPQYILVDPYSEFYDQFSAAYHPVDFTMQTAANHFLQTGNYSVSYSLDGIVMLNRTKTVNVQKFVPISSKISMNPTVVSAANSSVQGVKVIQYSANIPFLVPGDFELTIASSVMIKGDFTVLGSNNTKLGEASVPGNTNYVFNVSIKSFYSEVYFTFLTVSNNNDLQIQISMNQITAF